MSLRAALSLAPPVRAGAVLAAKQSLRRLGIASDEEQERPRNDIRLIDNTHPQRKNSNNFFLQQFFLFH